MKNISNLIEKKIIKKVIDVLSKINDGIISLKETAIKIKEYDVKNIERKNFYDNSLNQIIKLIKKINEIITQNENNIKNDFKELNSNIKNSINLIKKKELLLNEEIINYGNKIIEKVKKIRNIYNLNSNDILQIDESSLYPYYEYAKTLQENYEIIEKIEVDTKKEKEKENNLHKKILERERLLRTNNNNNDSEVNQFLEDMCIYGMFMKKRILQEQKIPNKFIKIDDALKLENQNQGLFALGLLAKQLENLGILTAIDNNISEEENATCLQFISSGYFNKKKYDLKFDFGEEKNDELLNDDNEYQKFKNNLKLKISKDYNISTNKIIITNPTKGSFHVQLIFQSDEFNNLDIDSFKNKFKNDKQFPQLNYLKSIHQDAIMSGCKLSKNQLDPRGNRIKGWGINEKRGGIEYDPPLDWIGIGLKVLGKYNNDIWIGMENVEGEWCVAYHGIGRNENNSNEIKKITGLIYKGGFKPGYTNRHENCLDQKHPGKKVGIGVYCSQLIKTAENFSGISNINGKQYKTVMMVRVNPNYIRYCNCQDSIKGKYLVVDGTPNTIRPYRILYKECK